MIRRYCPTWLTSSSPCTPSGLMSPHQVETLADLPSLPGPDLHAQDRGSGPPPSSWPRPWQKLQHRCAAGPPTPSSLPSHADPAHRSVVNTPFTAATRGLSAPCSYPFSPRYAPTPLARPATSANTSRESVTIRPSYPWPTATS